MVRPLYRGLHASTSTGSIGPKRGYRPNHPNPVAEITSLSDRSPAAEPATERPVILAVVYLLGACAILGLAGVIGLIVARVEASSLAALTALVGPALGGLASILATTRTSPATSSQKTSGPDGRAGLAQADVRQ